MLALGAVLLSSNGCTREEYLGDDCHEPDCTCTKAACVCAAAEQDLSHLPSGCDLDAETCDDAAIPTDTSACRACLQRNVDASLARTPLLDCACQHCAVQLEACRNGPGGDSDPRCQNIVSCALRRNCTGTECYCGAGVTLDQCRELDAGRGPCAADIADALLEIDQCEPGERQGACLMRIQEDGRDNALHRAFVLSQCMGNPLYRLQGNCLGNDASVVDVDPRQTR
jgi:hypothetical protein